MKALTKSILINPITRPIKPATAETVMRIGVITAALLVISHVSLLILAGSPAQETFINDAMAPFSTLLAFVGLAYGAFRSRNLTTRSFLAWSLIAGAGFLMAAGDTTRFTIEILLHRAAVPSLADVFYLAIFPIFLAASLIFPKERISYAELGRFALDITIIILSSTLVIWKIIIGPTLAAGADNPLALSIAVAYPVGDLILVWSVVMLVLRPQTAQHRRPIWFLLSAAIFIVIGDALAVAPQAESVSPNAGWYNIFFLLSPLMLMLAGMSQAVNATTPTRTGLALLSDRAAKLIYCIRLMLPYAWLGGAYLVLALEPYAEPVLSHACIISWVATIILLVIVRQVLVLIENMRLSRDLAQLNDDLEIRVLERTRALADANDELRQQMSQREHAERALSEREEKLAHNAMHDALTGLPNRTLLMDRLAHSIRRQKRQKDYFFALLFLDFDRFKTVNDSQGHLFGDQLLVEIGNRLRAFVREVDTVTRLGGDEFVILLEGIDRETGPCRAADRLLEVLAEPFEVASSRIFLSASIGVVPSSDTYLQPADILRDADLAMYEAKAQGKARYVLFTPNLRTHALDRLVLESDMRQALEQNEFRLHYQPIMSLETNRFTGFEALLRWQHPERGLIPPIEFIPIAETSGMIVPLTRWVLLEACRQMRAWQVEIPGGASLSISVNLSPTLFTHPDLMKMVDDALSDSGLGPESLKLEITEGTIIEESVETRKILNIWRQRGIRVHMDDFGTGYSSLSYLHQFPIDTLKIDRAFIKQLQGIDDQGQVVRTILALAKELNIDVIAEGVETARQLDFLKRSGCQYAQGFYISKPLTPKAIQALLVERVNN